MRLALDMDPPKPDSSKEMGGMASQGLPSALALRIPCSLTVATSVNLSIVAAFLSNTADTVETVVVVDGDTSLRAATLAKFASTRALMGSAIALEVIS